MNRVRHAFRSALFWVSFIGIVAAVVLGAWWSLMLVPEFGEEDIYIATAQEAMEDACSNARLLNYMDITLTTYSSDWTPSGYRVEARASRTAYAEQTFIDDVLESETVRITRELDRPGARSSENTAAMIEVTEYSRPAGGQWETSQFTEEEVASGPAFCGWSTEEFQNLTRIGTETLNGATTTKYAAARDPAGDKWDATWEFWVTDAGQLTQMVIHMRDGKAKLVYYDFNEVNVITPPVGPTPTLSSGPTPTPTSNADRDAHPGRDATPTPEPTPTPPPTPEPTVTPTQVPASPDAWLEPNPEDFSHNRQWRQFTLHAQGIQELHLSTNVYNPSGPSSTGAVELTSNGTLPSPADACERTYYTGYTVTPGYSFSLVGCTPGTVIIDITDPSNDYAVIRRYTLTVTSGP